MIIKTMVTGGKAFSLFSLSTGRAVLGVFLIGGPLLMGCAKVSSGLKDTLGLSSSEDRVQDTSELAEDNAALAYLSQTDAGKRLNKEALLAAVKAQHTALRANAAGISIHWSDKKSATQGQVRPGPVYQVNNKTCRELTHTVSATSGDYNVRGIACLQDDGSWKTLKME